MKKSILFLLFLFDAIIGFNAANGQGKGTLTNFGNKWGWTGTDEAFVPQLVMYANPPYFYNNLTKIDADIDTFLVQHGFNGFHIKVYCRWFDLNQEDCGSIVGSNPSIDIRTFDALKDLITKTYAAGGMVHIWMWGDSNLNPSVRPDWGGLNGPVEMKVLKEIANRLGQLPGWTMGYGFDIHEWATQAEAATWRDSLQAFLPQFHFLGARPHGPNTGTNHAPYVPWNQSFDYSSYEHHKPGYDVYVAALDALPDRPVMSEDRFRIRNIGNPKDYTLEETRRGLWNSTMAGGVANIWGNLTNGGTASLGSAVYPNSDQIKTYSLFFENRFKKDMIAFSSGTIYRLERPTNSDYIFYQDSTSSIQMDLSSMMRPQTAVAVDAKLPYAEIPLGTLNPALQTWNAPYESDWAIAVGDFTGNQAPIANAGPDQTVVDFDGNGSEIVTLDGSASFDPDGTLVSYDWTEGGNQIATGANPNVTLNLGSHDITLTVTDDEGETDSDTVTIAVNQPMPVFRVERSTGDVFAKGSFIGGGADLAERIHVTETVEPGDVVELDPSKSGYYRKARGYSQRVVGVITTRPGFTLGNGREKMELANGAVVHNPLLLHEVGRPMLALMGRVPVKATTENGPIRPGDLLTVSSSKPGYAMRCAETKAFEGVIIAKALQVLETGEGKILALVMSH